MATLSFRINDKDRKLIDRAAEALNKTRTAFVLDAVRVAATDALLDRRLFPLDPVGFRKFERALARAPTARQVATKLKRRPSPWKV